MPLSKDIISQTLRTPRGEKAYTIVETLHDAGFDTWWVGGCVRDMLNGKMPLDFDIATEAHPIEVKKLFSHYADDAEQFGTIVVHESKDSFEVTTFREDDSASDGRHPESVTFGKKEHDAFRRDFTINAIYFHPLSYDLFDPFEGEKDLRENLIRFVGDPRVRIEHDALRLLRAIRFRSYINGQYHPDTYHALQEHASLIEILSGTRRFEELEKMLLGPRPSVALNDMEDTSILKYFLPELLACKGVPQPKDYHHEGDVWDHMMMILQSFTEDHSVDVRIAALFHDCGKAQTFSIKERIRFNQHASVSGDLSHDALERLQCPKKRKDKIVWMVRHHMMMGSFFEMNDERKAHWYFHPWFTDLLKLFWLDIAGTDPQDFTLYERILADYHQFLDVHPRPEKPLLSGSDVMEILGITPGEDVGKALSALADAQVKKEVTTKKEAIAFLRKYT